MNTTSNDIPLGSATGYCYIYQAALYCEACGEAIRARLDLGLDGAPPLDPDDETSYDSDDYPKGPHAVDEADCPQHCDACHVFLENDLTDEGAAYVAMQVLHAWERWDLEGVAITEWAPFYGVDAPAYIGVEKPMSHEIRINLANAPQDGEGGDCFVFAFGAYADTLVAAWGRGIEDCLEEAAGRLADNAPGHLSDLAETYNEYHLDARAKGATEEQEEEYAREQSETDMTYTDSGYLRSWEWTYVLENPTQAEMLAYLGDK